ncbi:MAG: recombinase family protein [Thiotrichales bacterium]
MKIGYARVSSTDQNLDRQIAALRAEGCARIFREKASGRTGNKRPELEKAIDALGTNDVFVIAEWDRATRSYEDGLKMITRIAERHALVKVLDRDYFDLTTDLGKALLGLLSAIASDERKRILKRANDGRKIARANGVKFGPRHKLSEHQKNLVRKRKAKGESHRAIAADLGVSHQTIGRV